MEYADLTGNILAFSRQSASDLKCKFRHNADFVCCTSYSLTRKTWKIGVLKKPYLPRNVWGLNVYVPQPTVEEDFARSTDSSEDGDSENENIGIQTPRWPPRLCCLQVGTDMWYTPSAGVLREYFPGYYKG